MIKVILFDFDGVILDSMPIRDYGFRKIFEKYPDELVENFIKYHRKNGGLSRFHKIEYFYKTLLKKDISEKKNFGICRNVFTNYEKRTYK